MNKIYIILIAFIKTVGIVAHADLEQAKKIDFAQKRRAMLDAHLKVKQAKQGSLEKEIESLKGSMHNNRELPHLEAELLRTKEEIEQLLTNATVMENSIKALMAKK